MSPSSPGFGQPPTASSQQAGPSAPIPPPRPTQQDSRQPGPVPLAPDYGNVPSSAQWPNYPRDEKYDRPGDMFGPPNNGPPSVPSFQRDGISEESVRHMGGPAKIKKSKSIFGREKSS
jgi:hypothetical protein